MDAAAFEQVYGAFGDFHTYFAPLFGRRETRDHSRYYLQALLVQSGERRNATSSTIQRGTFPRDNCSTGRIKGLTMPFEKYGNYILFYPKRLTGPTPPGKIIP